MHVVVKYNLGCWMGTEEHESSLHSKGIWKWRTRTCVMVLYYIVKLSNVEREIKKQI